MLRETPFLLPLDGDAEQRIVEGAIDLAYVAGDGRWIVVDWKTDLGDLDAPVGDGSTGKRSHPGRPLPPPGPLVLPTPCSN